MAELEGIQIDSDWKAQAQAEKEKLAAKAKAEREAKAQQESTSAAPSSAAGSPQASAQDEATAQTRQLPPADFSGLVTMLASNAMMSMGAMADRRTGQPMLDLDIARHYIDLLQVVENKSAGNMTEDEKNTLASTLYELRSRYVQLASASLQKDG